MYIAILAVLMVLVSLLFSYLNRRTKFAKLNNTYKQIIIGVSFGILSCLATRFGTQIVGATLNIRDAAPISAGLIFGGPAGIIAGIIGGVHRWITAPIYSGMFTRAACTISTIICGFIAAIARSGLFKNRRPTWMLSLVIGINSEVIHMLMVFLTNFNDLRGAFDVIKVCALPMIIINSLTVMLSVMMAAIFSDYRNRHKGETKHYKHISQSFQKGLIFCIIGAFALIAISSQTLQSKLSTTESEVLLKQYIVDVNNEIRRKVDKDLIDISNKIKADLETKTTISNGDLNNYLDKYEVSEVSVIDKNGIIIYSTKDQYVGFDMDSGEQSREFLCLNDGSKTEFVQNLTNITNDSNISMKYAGVSLDFGGFVQVGYDDETYYQIIDSVVIGLTNHRHVGSQGYLLVTDRDFNIISGLAENSHLTTFKLDLKNTKHNTLLNGNYENEKFFYMYDSIEGYFIIAVIPQSEALYFRDVSIYITIFIIVIILGALYMNIYTLVDRQVVSNIQKVNNTLSQITDGNLDAVVDVKSHEEFASLSDDINYTVATLKDYIAQAAARIDKDLEFAKSIQASALPRVFPPYPNRTEFEIYATMNTAKEVGGDFYDFFFVGKDKICFLIADVSGKGIPAAMFMMESKTIIKSLAESGMSCSEVFTKANASLCASNEAEMFVTSFICMIDLSTGVVEFANAGHNPPLICKNETGYEYFKTRAGLVLAGMDGVNYRSGEFKLEPGESIFLYTDGVTEANNVNKELFSEERLLDVLNNNKKAGPAEICAVVKEKVDEFVGEADQFDDITMLAFKYLGR